MPGRSRFAAALVLLSIAGCAAQQETSQQRSADAPAASGGDAGERKLVYRAEVWLNVERFDAIPSRVEELAARFDGFVAEARIRGAARDRRQGSWTLRVPADRFNPFLAALGELGEVVDLHRGSQDVTAESVDLDARLRNAIAQEQRLLAVLSEATGNLEEILAVEKELARVREELERMQSRQKLLQEQVALSTITLTIEEMKAFFPNESASYAAKVRRTLEISLTTLATTLQDLSLVFVALLPWLVAVLLPLGLLTLLVRRWRRVPARMVQE